jgi:hypothetical protein
MYQCVEQLIDSSSDNIGNSNDVSNESDNKSQDESESENDTDDEPENEPDEIEIKGIIYILEDDQVYVKNENGSKGKLYGIYSNGKVKKVSSHKNIEI